MIRKAMRSYWPMAATGVWLVCAATVQAGGPNDAALLDVFPASTFTAEARGQTQISDRFEPSVGPWAQGLDERKVFGVSMKHEQGETNSYELRIGKGGQVYSLAGPFGESVPPSWRDERSRPSAWNDEVWQAVAVCTRYNKTADDLPWLAPAGDFQTSFFIHNSGCYGDAPELGDPQYYCPLLASHSDPEARLHRQVNWGLVPQRRTIHRSPLLFYLQVRDAGEGVIELTWVVHNFSVRDDVVFDYFNMPWGGTRVSSLPLHYASRPDGSLELEDVVNSRFANGVNVEQTAGFALSSAGPEDDAPALALVYGLDKHFDGRAAREGESVQFRPSIYRSWRANGGRYERDWKDFKTRPANSFRNFQVVEVIPKLRLKPQSTIGYRSYLVVGTKASCRATAAKLVEHVDYGERTFPRETTPMLVVRSAAFPFDLYAQPVPGSMPVFLIRRLPDGPTIYSTDPYRFVPREPLAIKPPADHPDADYYRSASGYTLDGKSEVLSLMGYGLIEKPDEPGWRRLSEMAGKWALPSDSPHDVDLWVRVHPPTRR